MEILVHTDSKITARPDLERHVREALESRLARYDQRLTRVDVWFNEENSRSAGVPELRCTVEARPAGKDPVAVTADAMELGLAFDGALDKLAALLRTRFGKEQQHKGAPSIRTTPAD